MAILEELLARTGASPLPPSTLGPARVTDDAFTHLLGLPGVVPLACPVEPHLTETD